MPDVSVLGNQDLLGDFVSSQWFKRGGTLQELLAPKAIEFHNRRW